MHFLTKFFVVLVALLAVLLTALVVPFVAKTDDYGEALATERQRRVAAEQAARLKDAEIDVKISGYREERDQFSNQVLALQGDVATLRSNLEQVQLALKGEQAKTSSASADRTALIAQTEQLAQIVDVTQRELNQLREERVRRETQLIQLTNANDDLRTQLDTLERTVRRTQEQMHASQEQLRTLNAGLARLDPAARDTVLGREQEALADQPFMPTDVTIHGQITDMIEARDQLLVQVDVGTRDRVARNMKFLIHRGDQYVGSLVITDVDSNAAVGRVLSTVPGGQVAVGDRVLTGPVSN